MSCSSPTATASVERPTGPPSNFDADRAQDLAVQAVEPALVHLEHLERRPRGLRGDHALHAHLGEVAHALEQAVGHARGAPAARRDRVRAVVLEVDLEDARGAPHDDRELVHRVGLEARLDAEAVAQRRASTGPCAWSRR